MFHFETSFCVMGDSWWPRNTEKKIITRKFKDETLGVFCGFFTGSACWRVGEFLAFRKIHRRVIYKNCFSGILHDFTNTPRFFLFYFPNDLLPTPTFFLGFSNHLQEVRFVIKKGRHPIGSCRTYVDLRWALEGAGASGRCL